MAAKHRLTPLALYLWFNRYHSLRLAISTRENRFVGTNRGQFVDMCTARLWLYRSSLSLRRSLFHGFCIPDCTMPVDLPTRHLGVADLVHRSAERDLLQYHLYRARPDAERYGS